MDTISQTGERGRQHLVSVRMPTFLSFLGYYIEDTKYLFMIYGQEYALKIIYTKKKNIFLDF